MFELLTRLLFSHRQAATHVLYPAVVIFALADLTPRRNADGRSLGRSRQETQVGVLFGVTVRIAAKMTARYVFRAGKQILTIWGAFR